MPSQIADYPTTQWLRSTARRFRWGVSTMRRGLRRPRRLPWPAEATDARRDYETRLWEVVSREIQVEGSVPLQVFSFSSRSDLPEQVASIQSFLVHAGRPSSWTVVSDGSHSEEERAVLQAIHPSVEVVDWRLCSPSGLPRALWDYARVDAMGKRLVALASLPADRPVLYTDADILFYPAAGEPGALAPVDGTVLYMQDSELRRSGPLAGQPALDTALLHDEAEEREVVNAGFFLVNGRLEWMPAFLRLEGLRWKPATFAGQTVVHLTLHLAGCRPLDPTRYVLAADDRDVPEDPYVGADTVLRHYARPVRHKFWTAISLEDFAP